MNIKLVLLALFFASTVAYSQSIKGKLFDAQTKEPLVGAKIEIVESGVFTLSNHEGYFELNAESPVMLRISLIGYETHEVPEAQGSLSLSLSVAINEMQEVVVTANREASLRTESPMAISKITPKMIDETKPTSIYEVVNKTSGVLMVSLNNEQHSMSIRQPITTNGYYLYMEDGIGIRPMGVFNHNALLEINQFAISSIEVVKGPVSSIYGPEAVGGAINFITQRPTAVPSAKIGLQFDQWGYRRLQFGAGGQIKKFGIYVSGLTSLQRDSWMKSSDYDKNIVNVRLEYSFTPRTRLTGTVMYGKYYSQMSGSVDSTSFFSRDYVSTSDFTYRKSEASRSKLIFEHDWNNSSRTMVTVFNRYNKHGQNPSYGIRWTSGQPTARGEINSNDFVSYGVIAQHSQAFQFLNSRLITGGMFDYSPNAYSAYQVDLFAQLRPGGTSVEQYTIDRERPDIQLANYKAIIRNAAGYMQYDVELFKKLRISGGVRYDRMSFTYDNQLDQSSGSKEYSQFTPKIGVTYDLGRSKGLYANYAQGFAPPALTAIFRKRPNTTPAEFYYNLEPAQFQNYEIGGWASFWKNKIYIDVAVYQMNGTNELLNIRQPDNSFDYQSAGKTLHRGIELGVTVKPTSEFFFRWSGTTALHRFENFQVSNKATDAVQNLDGYEMPSAPRWIWNTEFSYYPKWFKNFRTSIEWQYVSGYYQNQVNTVRYEGYTLLNARAGYQWKGIEVFVNVMNVTDALYATNASRGNNATDRTTYTPAAPRTFVMGLQYNFNAKPKNKL